MVDPFSGASLNNAVSPCNRESVIAVMRQPGMDAEEPRQRILRNGKYVWTNSEKAIRERETEECEQEDEDTEEGMVAKGIRCENKPSPQEVEEHEKTHVPFRIWCQHCVMGRGKEDHHRRKRDGPQNVRKICWDYMYMKENPTNTKHRDEIVEGEGNPIIVMKDSWSVGGSGGILAFAVPNKGMDEYAIQRGSTYVNKVFGYDKMIFKSDQEPAIVSYLECVKSHAGNQIMCEHSPVGDSKSDGEIENAV